MIPMAGLAEGGHMFYSCMTKHFRFEEPERMMIYKLNNNRHSTSGEYLVAVG